MMKQLSDEKIFFKHLAFLRDFSRVYTQLIMEGKTLRQYDLKQSQIKTLYSFRDKDCITMKEFAITLGKKFPNTTIIVDGLEKEGIVERKHGQQDRRKVFVTLTAKGKEIRDGFLKQHHIVSEYIYQHITEKESGLLLKSLENVRTILGLSFVNRMNTKKEPHLGGRA